MHLGLPVVAYRAAAVPETVGDAGVVLSNRDPLIVACAVDRVLSNSRLRSQLAMAGRQRAESFALARSGERLLQALAPILEQQEARRA
jgi:glycosyltransferase involved in cell wall biosynthesis